MTKPFPCCCNACVFCPDYTGQDWIFRFCGLTIGTDTLTSSTTGNPLHTDLMALGDIIYVPSLIAGPTPRTLTASGITLLGLAGNSYTYSSGFVYEEPFTMSVAGFDDCGKRRLTDVILRCKRSGTSNTIIWRASGGGFPAVPNCGEELTAGNYSVSTDSRVFAATGRFKTILDAGFPLVCP